mmetsp:Transcript_11918/g.26531  ORF Transcript_11918/g.26531 Transcript_11918/m.26531 type:complete len:400 (-) Transcript_11918:168-1367(-)
MAADVGPPQQVGGGYTRIREIGEGSYGKAMLVRDQEQKHYVMKIINLKALDSTQRKEAINEVKVLSMLKHPYIISYRESFVEKRNLFIVMDYAAGGDLARRISCTREACKFFPEERLVRWFTEATLALKYLHSKHVLHRDFKCENMFLTVQDRLRVGDFGISKILENTAAVAKTALGTPYYFSPEVCLSRPYSWSSDIWSLGCVLYEMASLSLPFTARTFQELVLKICGPPPVLRNGSTELKQLCSDLLCYEPGQRPSASDILERPLVKKELRRMLREEKSKDQPESPCKSQPGSPPLSKDTSLVHLPPLSSSASQPQIARAEEDVSVEAQNVDRPQRAPKPLQAAKEARNESSSPGKEATAPSELSHPVREASKEFRNYSPVKEASKEHRSLLRFRFA